MSLFLVQQSEFTIKQINKYICVYTYIGWLLVWLVGCVWLVGWLVGCGWLVCADWLKIWRFSRKCSVKHFSHQKCQKIKKSPLGDIFSPKNTKNVVFHTFGSKLDLWLNPLAYGSVRKCTEPGVRKCTEGYGSVRKLYGSIGESILMSF